MIGTIITLCLMIAYYFIATTVFYYFATKWKMEHGWEHPGPFFMAAFFPITVPAYLASVGLHILYMINTFAEFGRRIAKFERDFPHRKKRKEKQIRVQEQIRIQKPQQRNLSRRDHMLVEAEEEVEELLSYRRR